MPRFKKFQTSKRLKLILILLVLVLLIAGIIAQIMFNMYVNDVLQSQSMYNLHRDVHSAISRLHDNKKEPTELRQIPEVNLQFSAYTDKVEDFRYEDYTFEDGKQYLLVTSEDMYYYGIGRLGGSTTEEYFARVPEAQACSRGLMLTFDTEENWGDSTQLAAQKDLADGRKMRIYQEPSCHYDGLNDLVQSVLQAESY